MLEGFGSIGTLVVPAVMSANEANRFSNIERCKVQVERTLYAYEMDYDDILKLSDEKYKELLGDLQIYRKYINELEWWLTGNITYDN